MDPLQQAAPAEKTFARHFTEVTSLSKTLAAIILIILPFVGFYLGYLYAPATEVSVTESAPTPLASSTPQTKRSYLGGEIPVSWSNYDMGDINILDAWPPTDGKHMNVVNSIAANKITFGDWNSEQIDIYYLDTAGKDAYLENARDPEQIDVTIAEKSFNEVPVTVITWPLDNGEVTKGGTGGSSYLLQTGEAEGEPLYVLISKQAFGDPTFEQAFAHYLDTIDFKKLQKDPWYRWEE